jgi:valyl-tRNA synthetase
MPSKLQNYDPSSVEGKWRNFWETNKTFHVTSVEEADFVITLPPPNVTGELHMGHALNATLQDILIRYHRMNGQKVHWQIGSDHAGIGTQIVVEKQLAKEGKTKYSVGRKAFEELTWEWTKKHKGRIEEQLKILGCSADYTKSKFTLDEDYVNAVRLAFFKLFEEGLVYQGTRLINWCPHCLTSLSDLEVVHEERKGKLYKIKYPLEKPHNGLKELTVATSRPETLFGDVAVAINPQDERYSQIIDSINKGEQINVHLPLTNKLIPIILSEAVEKDFGTGALKITPAHDFNDEQIAASWKDDLGTVNIFNKKAELLALDFIPQELHGLERFKAREKTLELLTAQELLVDEEVYKQSAALHDRCGNVIEPYLSKQWFVRMQPLAKLAIDALEEGRVKFHPARYSKTYLDWLKNIKDWCISRQLWWGHQIPVWIKPSDEQAKLSSESAELEHKRLVGEFRKVVLDHGMKIDLASDKKHSTLVFAEGKNNKCIFQYNEDGVQLVILNADPELEKKFSDLGYTQDPDVLDTWFSSALWPIATLGWPTRKTPKNEKWSNVLSTAREIINLWVSRMIYSSLKLTENNLPFTDILIHPVLQTPDGKRMSKSKGNAIDPIELVNKYGADASRLWYASVSIFSNQDVRFPGKKEKDGSFTSDTIEQKRKFVNKLWNATKFVLHNIEGFAVEKQNLEELQASSAENIWIINRWNETLKALKVNIESFRFSEFINTLEDFVWNDFCDWYLELAKVNLNGEDQTLKDQTRQILYNLLEEILRALHPVMPFATEELWQELTSCGDGLAHEDFPGPSHELVAARDEIAEFIKFQSVSKSIRSVRQKILGLNPNEEIELSDSSEKYQNLIKKFSNFLRIKFSKQEKGLPQTVNFDNGEYCRFFVSVPEKVDLKKRIEVLEKELNGKKTELTKLEERAANQGFMANASDEIKEELYFNIKNVKREIEDLTSSIHSINSYLEQHAN